MSESKTSILIDDDELVRMTWTFKAKSSGSSLQVYDSFQSFKNDLENIDRSSTIYLDSDLGVELTGEELAEEISQLGFKEIHLVTGKDADLVTVNRHLFTSIRGKEPPF